ncbi:MAG: hypothetical protein WCD42_05320 [Rhizomicrobium sp.]
MAARSAFLLIWLTGCAGSNDVPLSLPEAPAGLVACANDPVPAVPGAKGSALTKAQTIESFADQRSTALAKDHCARAWLAYYADLYRTVARMHKDPHQK